MGKVKQFYADLMENLDELENEEIRHLINIGIIKEEDVVHHYGNPWWEDIP